MLSARLVSLALLLSLLPATASAASAAPAPPAGGGVRTTHKDGSSHGFITVRDASGKLIAVGDQINFAEGNTIRSRLIIRFRDGSIDDEHTVFTQAKTLQLVSDRHIQRGPSYKDRLDQDINVRAGTVTWHEYKDGKDTVKTDHMDLPPDLANGLIPQVIENFPHHASEMKVSYIAGSKPRLVHLSIKPGVNDPFYVGGIRHTARRFDIHIEIGGVAGVIAPVIGKQPSDIEMWAMDGEVPTFLKMQAALYQQGPIWTLELASPTWPKAGK